jgi:Rad3-related DNA helicase
MAVSDVAVSEAAVREAFVRPSFREGQQEAICFILDAFRGGKRFVILEGPTGSGKSAIALTVAKFFANSFYLTVQKVLQSQIITDFGSSLDLVELKGRNAYECVFFRQFGERLVAKKALSAKRLEKLIRLPPSADVGYCREKLHKSLAPQCFQRPLPENSNYSFCPYFEQLGRCVAAKMALLNFSSFLYQTSLAHRFAKRELMVVDEAHQLEAQLLGFISISISSDCMPGVKFELPEYETAEQYWEYFVACDLLGAIRRCLLELQASDDVRKKDALASLYRRVGAFFASMEAEQEWVVDWKVTEQRQTVLLRPVFVHNQASPLVFRFADKILLMSATILDVQVLCAALGIPRAQVASYRMCNRFPVDNRRIFLYPVADIKGGKAKMGEWMPKLVSRVDELVAKYPRDRGIIHTHNFAIAEGLMAGCKQRSRFLFQRNFPNKEVMLARHAATIGSVLVAPAMHEGLDLVEDLSRFQIICKVPWPNLYEDKQLERRVQLDHSYLIWLVALKLVQSTGRSVRSEVDWAHTYIIDGVIDRFIAQARRILPSWFLEALTEYEPSSTRSVDHT